MVDRTARCHAYVPERHVNPPPEEATRSLSARGARVCHPHPQVVTRYFRITPRGYSSRKEHPHLMASVISAHGLTLHHAAKRVFTDLSIGLSEGDRIGVVGRNGEGKSTLLGLLAQTIEPESGEVIHRTGLTVGVLPQQDDLLETDTVIEAIMGDTPEYVWASDARIRDILAHLLLEVKTDTLVGELSGGQRRRVQLARLLSGTWDILLMDEPTNHLDMHGIKWLAQHLNEYNRNGRGALVVISHDRWFLDEVCTTMWEVHDETVDSFEGGYSAYILRSVERQEAAEAAFKKQQNIMRKELAWLSRGARARATKPKFHVALAEELIAAEPPVRNTVELKRMALTRLGKKVIDLTDVGLERGGTSIFQNITWKLGTGDRYGIVGANGAGKSSLLDVITGRMEPTTGRVERGTTVEIGFLTQRLTELEEWYGYRVYDVLRLIPSYVVIDGEEVTPAQLLERLGFSPEHLKSYVEALSGGQKRRLQLMIVLLRQPNVLILDEPGNDMDTEMLTVMEDLLDSWPGTMILVTHDRYLMERVVDDVYALVDGRFIHEPRGVEGYLDRTPEPGKMGAVPPQNTEASEQQAESGISSGERYRLQKQLDSLERRTRTITDRIEELKAGLLALDPSDYQGLISQQELIESGEKERADLEAEWFELLDRMG